MFDESLIYNAEMGAKECAEAICHLRLNSVAERYNKVSSKSDELVYAYLKTTDEVL